MCLTVDSRAEASGAYSINYENGESIDFVD